MWPFAVGKGEVALATLVRALGVFRLSTKCQKTVISIQAPAKESEVARHGKPWKIPSSWHNLYN